MAIVIVMLDVFRQSRCFELKKLIFKRCYFVTSISIDLLPIVQMKSSNSTTESAWIALSKMDNNSNRNTEYQLVKSSTCIASDFFHVKRTLLAMKPKKRYKIRTRFFLQSVVIEIDL